MRCRVLPHEIADGPANMAIDQTLLDAVDAAPDAAILRTYGWSEPTLSLGYFQSMTDLESDPRWQTVPVVRRPTGGGALWHDRELTYALVVPRSHPLALRPSDLYRAVHAAIASWLRGLGLDARRRGSSSGEPSRPFLCFLDQDPEDILLDGRKIVGSAQRRRPAAVLQHGALLLARSGTTPELPGLRELSGPDSAGRPWPELIARAIPTALGLDPHGSRLDASERATADRLAGEVYRDPTWTRRR